MSLLVGKRQKLLFIVLFLSVAINLIFTYKWIYHVYYVPQKQIQERWDALEHTAPDHQEIIFVGTSLTQLFPLNSVFNNWHIKNMGFVRIQTPAILINVKRICKRQPHKLFIEGGINDISSGRSADSICKTVVEMCTAVKAKSPKTIIFIQSVLPTSFAKHNVIVGAYNNKIETYCKQNAITYISIYKDFLKGGKLNPIYTTDGIHLNQFGYAVWKDRLAGYVSQ